MVLFLCEISEGLVFQNATVMVIKFSQKCWNQEYIQHDKITQFFVFRKRWLQHNGIPLEWSKSMAVSYLSSNIHDKRQLDATSTLSVQCWGAVQMPSLSSVLFCEEQPSEAFGCRSPNGHVASDEVYLYWFGETIWLKHLSRNLLYFSLCEWAPESPKFIHSIAAEGNWNFFICILGRWYCSTCPRSYKAKGALRNHKRFGCNTPPQFVCQVCDQRFTRPYQLKNHMVCIHRIIWLCWFGFVILISCLSTTEPNMLLPSLAFLSFSWSSSVVSFLAGLRLVFHVLLLSGCLEEIGSPVLLLFSYGICVC